ncbi:MAG TPA: FAD-binding protein, partial [Candidatus Dormibacteraeota bacterium]|nr:FAD-binding protein [Candidatus Dormibacteraeota bacterium]
MDFESYDVLVVGGGLAGIRAAIAAVEANPRVRVGMVSKVYPMRSHTVSAEGGAAAVMAANDSYETHAFDTIKGSDYLADQDVVEAFVREAPIEIVQMDHWGCPWSRNEDGTIAVRPFGGMTTWRTVFAADKSGFHMLHTVFQTSLKYPQIKRHDEVFVTKLLVEDSRCVGVVGYDVRSGRFDAIMAKSVILATGGLGRIYAFTTNGNICTADGMALAYRAGAGLKDMEMVQFHPTGLPFTGILITEAVRGEGGYLLNNENERFLKRYVPNKMELGPRDIISRAMITEFEAGRGFEGPHGRYMHLDVRHLGEDVIDRRLPFMRELGREFLGIDIVTEPIPVRPVQHYMMGGVDADIEGKTAILGLYAAGECANVGLNGGNRLGSNSLPECLVFGAAAGRAAAHHAAS